MKIVSLGSSYYLIWLLGTAPPNSYASSLPNLTALGIPAVSPVSSIMIQIYLFSGNPAGFCFSTLQLTGSLAILWAKEISLGTRATQPLLAFCYNRFHTHVSAGLQLAPGPKVYWNLCCDSSQLTQKAHWISLQEPHPWVLREAQVCQEDPLCLWMLHCPLKTRLPHTGVSLILWSLRMGNWGMTPRYQCSTPII